MTSREETLRKLAALCGELGPDDGIDPRHDRRQHPRKENHRKTHQLCKQVETTLNLYLAGSEAPRLRELVVLGVEPAPNSSHLLVVVGPAPGPEPLAPAESLDALHQVAGRLRSEVAGSIHRKRAPELSYRFLPYGEGER